MIKVFRWLDNVMTAMSGRELVWAEDYRDACRHRDSIIASLRGQLDRQDARVMRYEKILSEIHTKTLTKDIIQ